MKGSQEETVEDGNRPTESLVDLVPSCGEDLHNRVGDKDEKKSEQAVGRLVGVPETHRQDYVCNGTVKIWPSKH